MNIPLFEKCNVLLSLMTNNSSMNRISVLDFLPDVKYIPLLCWIWPTFQQKSSLFYQQSLGMIQTRVPIFLKSPYSLGDKTRVTVQLITYTVPQNVLSLFTIHIQNCFSSEAELQIFFLEGRHLSKIQLGTNVTQKIYLSFVWSRVLFLSSFMVVVDLSKWTTCLHFHTFIYSKYDIVKRFPQ